MLNVIRFNLILCIWEIFSVSKNPRFNLVSMVKTLRQKIRVNFVAYIFVISGLLVGCDDNSSAEKIVNPNQWKDAYRIELGQDAFLVPTDYLLNSNNRMDGAQRYVVTVASIPDISPIENARTYLKPPFRTEKMISFDLNYYDGKVAAPDALLKDWAQNKSISTVVLPEKYETEGLVHLGVFKVAGKKENNIYAYIRDGIPIAQFRCGKYPDYPNPSCRVYQRYRDYMGLIVDFDIENLDWYAKEGMERVLEKVETWRIKNPNQ